MPLHAVGARRCRALLGHRGGLLILASILLGIFLIPAGIALAHANLTRSVPAANAVVDTAPKELRLWFSEPVEMRFAEVYLLDRTGLKVGALGPLQPESWFSEVIVVPVESLPPGVYTVVWRVLSAIDGHASGGAFAFAVGRDQVPPGGLRPTLPGASAGASGGLTVLGVAAKWLGYLSLALLVGGSAFFLVVWRGAPGTVPSSLFDVLFAGWVLAIVGALLGITQVAGTRQLLLFGMRLLVLGLLAAPVLRGRGRVRRQEMVPRRLWWTCLGLGSLALLSISLGSHAARGGEPSLNLAVDWLHMMVASIWVGGLAMLLPALPLLQRREKAQPLAAISYLVKRFSRLAAICVAILIATGAHRALFEVAALENLADTAYGTTLLVKLGLLAVLLGLATANLFLVGPRLASATRASRVAVAGHSWFHHLRQTVGGEAMFVLLALLATSVLTSLPPAREAFGSGLVVRGQGADLRAVLVVKSDEPGVNTIDSYLRDSAGRPVAYAEKVAFIFTTAGSDGVESEAVADNVGDGHYLLRGGYLSAVDKRNVLLIVRRRGWEDVRLTLDLSALDSRSEKP